MAAPHFTILVFDWNAAGLRLSESMNQIQTDSSRRNLFNFRPPAVGADFFELIRRKIVITRPVLVVIATQDEDSRDSYFHSELLPRNMPEIGYTILKRDRLEDVGEFASGATPTNVPSGPPRGSALRLSIYVQNEAVATFQAGEAAVATLLPPSGMKAITLEQGRRRAGALVAYVVHPQYGRFAFVLVDLPVGSEYLKAQSLLTFEEYRATTRALNTLCLVTIFNSFVTQLSERVRPDHTFLLGDMNYDISSPNKKNTEIITEFVANPVAAAQSYRPYDDFTVALKETPLQSFKEGVTGN